MATLRDELEWWTAPGKLYEALEEGSVRCTACAHRCLIRPGKHGICQVRFNRNGELRVPWGYVAAANTDPIEKKPFAHFLPGSYAFTFGMIGCDFHCSFCQNWLTTQPLRDTNICLDSDFIQRVNPQQLVDYALQHGAGVMASSYNEPLITTEWAVDIFKLARQAGMRCVYISNGYATPEVLAYLRPYLDGYKIDLKCMNEDNYRSLGGALQNVLDTIRSAHDLGLWVEVVTLVIPGFNDSPDELWAAARYLVSVSADIPWHVTAYHPDYHMSEPPPTPAASLQQAAEIGQEAGLHYVYAGNLPGRVGSLEDTFCPACQQRLIARRGYTILEYHLTGEGRCERCGAAVAGVWSEQPGQVRKGGWGWTPRGRR